MERGVGALTEEISERFRGIETRDDAAILNAIADGQADAIRAVRSSIPSLSAAARLLVEIWTAGGRIAFVGAGSSGLIALTDALELPGTFGMARDRLPILLAGADAALARLDGAAEDDTAAAEAHVATLQPGDAVIAVSASGSTPFTLAAARCARAHGCRIVGIACNADAPLLAVADVAVAIPVGPELPAGSTRMNAGTAQKCALNMLSTLTAMRLNHVFDGMMVNLQADNLKLRDRAIRIVSRAADVDLARAGAALQAAAGEVKPAILLARGAASAGEARGLLGATAGDLRAALNCLGARLRAETGLAGRPPHPLQQLFDREQDAQ
jgi:N-acetylmuramic acid 6-phosphate etherase